MYVILLTVAVAQPEQPFGRPDIPPHVAEYLDGLEKSTRARLKEINNRLPSMRRQLTALERARINPRLGRDMLHGRRFVVFRTEELRNDAVEKLEREIKEMESEQRDMTNGKRYYHPELTLPHEPGKIGRIDQIEVKQVIDSRNAIVAIHWRENTVVASGGGFAGKTLNRSADLWLRNYSTSGLVDGRAAELGQPFEIMGTETYATVSGGSRTIPVAEPFDVKKYRP